MTVLSHGPGNYGADLTTQSSRHAKLRFAMNVHQAAQASTDYLLLMSIHQDGIVLGSELSALETAKLILHLFRCMRTAGIPFKTYLEMAEAQETHP